MAIGSSSISNVIGLGGQDAFAPGLIIPEGNPSGYFTLYGGGAPGNNLCGPICKNGVAYQVPNGKTCKVMSIMVGASGAGQYIQLLSATSTFALGTATGSLVGPVYQSGAAAGGVMLTNTASVYQTFGCTYDFAQNTFPGYQNIAGGTTIFSVILICKEV